MYLMNLRDKFSQQLLYTSYSSCEEAIATSARGMFWLDGSSTLPFTIVSTSFVSKACVELTTKALAEIAKSWVKIGDFDYWCLTASKLVDLADDLIHVNTSF